MLRGGVDRLGRDAERGLSSGCLGAMEPSDKSAVAAWSSFSGASESASAPISLSSPPRLPGCLLHTPWMAFYSAVLPGTEIGSEEHLDIVPLVHISKYRSCKED